MGFWSRLFGKKEEPTFNLSAQPIDIDPNSSQQLVRAAGRLYRLFLKAEKVGMDEHSAMEIRRCKGVLLSGGYDPPPENTAQAEKLFNKVRGQGWQ
jgi:hypothetical protein